VEVRISGILIVIIGGAGVPVGNDLPGYLGRHEMLRTFSPKVSVAAAPVSVLTPEDVKAVEYLVRQGRSLSDGADEALNGNT
jgi:hypothetical protein